jgi:hypothetical protein
LALLVSIDRREKARACAREGERERERERERDRSQNITKIKTNLDPKLT